MNLTQLQSIAKSTWRASWGGLVWLFEKADIIPALVIVSVYHYGGAMAQHGDPAPVAMALGVLTDVGHYRSVKAVATKPQERRRWAVGLVLTILTGYYHYLWYNDVILAVCIPILIISLALLSKWDRWDAQASQPGAQPEAQPAQHAQAMRYSCGQCGASFASSGAYASHMRWQHRKP
ncbi:membrane hypothetical protein [Gammaproteobacteria bacterium]